MASKYTNEFELHDGCFQESPSIDYAEEDIPVEEQEIPEECDNEQENNNYWNEKIESLENKNMALESKNEELNNKNKELENRVNYVENKTSFNMLSDLTLFASLVLAKTKYNAFGFVPMIVLVLCTIFNFFFDLPSFCSKLSKKRFVVKLMYALHLGFLSFSVYYFFGCLNKMYMLSTIPLLFLTTAVFGKIFV